jgi:hypothetical protein
MVMSNDLNLFDLFGGIRAMAAELNESPSTVQSWKNHSRIPATKQPAVLRAAMRLGLTVDPLLVIFPLGIPDDFIVERDLFDVVVPISKAAARGGKVVAGSIAVACDRVTFSQPTVAP